MAGRPSLRHLEKLLLSGERSRCARGVRLLSAARPRRNRRTMRARTRVSKKCADLVRCFGRQNMLELARLLLDFGFAVHGERIGKQPLRQPMPANDVGRALVAAWG